MSDSDALSGETLEQRLKKMVQDKNSGFHKGYNLIVLGDSSTLNEVDWSSFQPELFIRSSVKPVNSMFLNNMLDSLCWEVDSRYSAMEMMGVNHIEDLISSPIPYYIIFDDSSQLHQLPLIWSKLKQLIRKGRGAGVAVEIVISD